MSEVMHVSHPSLLSLLCHILPVPSSLCLDVSFQVSFVHTVVVRFS